MSRATIAVIVFYMIYTALGGAVEILAGAGLVQRDTQLWAIFHPGWEWFVAALALLALATMVSQFARRALRSQSQPQ